MGNASDESQLYDLLSTILIPSNTTVTATNVSVPVSAADQNINLSATVTTNNAGTVNEGAMLFTLLKSDNITVIGQPTASTTVNQGRASVSYVLPAGTAAGTYIIKAVYLGTSHFTQNADESKVLTVGGTALTVPAAPLAVPSTANVGVSVNFFVGVTGNGNYQYTLEFRRWHHRERELAEHQLCLFGRRRLCGRRDRCGRGEPG